MPKGIKTVNSGVKVNAATKQARLEEAGEWILANPMMRTMDFVRFFGDKWGIQKNTLLKYKKEAEALIGKQFNENVHLEKLKAINNY